MKNKSILFIIWSIIFIFEMVLLIRRPSELSGFIIYTCCIAATIPIMAMAEELHKLKKKQKKGAI